MVLVLLPGCSRPAYIRTLERSPRVDLISLEPGPESARVLGSVTLLGEEKERLVAAFIASVGPEPAQPIDLIARHRLQVPGQTITICFDCRRALLERPGEPARQLVISERARTLFNQTLDRYAIERSGGRAEGEGP